MRLNYVKDALLARARSMSVIELEQMWQTAIDQKDTITLRVFMDFAGDMVRRKANKGTRGKPVEAAMQFLNFHQLAEATENLVSTPEQRRAREWLKGYEDARQKILFTKSGAMDELQRHRFNARSLVRQSDITQIWRS